jgi:hypothetical protein
MSGFLEGLGTPIEYSSLQMFASIGNVVSLFLSAIRTGIDPVWRQFCAPSAVWSLPEHGATPKSVLPDNSIKLLMFLQRLGIERPQESVERESTAVNSVSDLCSWLQLSQTEVLAILDVKERTYYHWQANPDSQPRHSNVVRLGKVHAMIELLVQRLGVDSARKRITSGSPSILERLRGPMDSINAVEDEVLDYIRSDQSQARSHLLGTTNVGRVDQAIALFSAAEKSNPDPLPNLVLPGSDIDEPRT